MVALAARVGALEGRAARLLGRSASAADAAPGHWADWLRAFFPRYATHPPAPHHAAIWDWAWVVILGERPPPMVGILARGGAKSTTAEMICAAWFARRQRRYIWYVSETQDQADDHIGTVAAMLESEAIARAYPRLSERMVGKFGNSKGWRRDRIRTADGFTVDALGLDVAARGVKLEEMRPDAIIFDDLDRQHDGPEIVEKKVRTLTRAILPSGSSDLAVLAIQNLIHDQGIFARLAGIADERADFLADRVVVGPVPALLGAAYEERDGRWYVVAGTPTWAGQDRAACQRIIDTSGLSAFRVECQHEVETLEGSLFGHLAFRHCRPQDVPDLVAVVVWVDPAVSSHDGSDAYGIQADGKAADETLYRLRSWEGVTTPRDALTRAILLALELKAEAVGVETDQGGETWEEVYRAAWRSLVEAGEVAADARMPAFRSAKAGAGHGPKVHRASLMLAEYERGRFVHVLGTHEVLEKALRRFPIRKPFDLADAAYWSWQDLDDPMRLYAKAFGVSGYVQAPRPAPSRREPLRDFRELDAAKSDQPRPYEWRSADDILRDYLGHRPERRGRAGRRCGRPLAPPGPPDANRAPPSLS